MAGADPCWSLVVGGSLDDWRRFPGLPAPEIALGREETLAESPDPDDGTTVEARDLEYAALLKRMHDGVRSQPEADWDLVNARALPLLSVQESELFEGYGATVRDEGSGAGG